MATTWVYFALNYAPGLVHVPDWFGTLNNTLPFQGSVVVKWYNDVVGIAYGKCSTSVWYQYQQALMLQNVGESASLANVVDINNAIQAANW